MRTVCKRDFTYMAFARVSLGTGTGALSHLFRIVLLAVAAGGFIPRACGRKCPSGNPGPRPTGEEFHEG
jgi:hypothetical protein